MTEDEIIQSITDIRSSNNILWMKLLTVALKSAPEETKALLKQIKENDHRISTLTWQLTQ